jgi:hypothetical protein
MRYRRKAKFDCTRRPHFAHALHEEGKIRCSSVYGGDVSMHYGGHGNYYFQERLKHLIASMGLSCVYISVGIVQKYLCVRPSN